MVGIEAGIPNLPKQDIRLGHITVSIPQDNHSGVVQYDFGRYEQDEFVFKGSLDKPPPILISADGSLEEDEIMNKRPLRKILKEITKNHQFARPIVNDVLFENDFHHINKGADCGGCEASSEKKLVPRPLCQQQQPVIYQGLILSGNGVVKDPAHRDHLHRDYNTAICFEMEAAGIVYEIPCLVIRGICDYADTHKQDGWHYYAAAVAAAYCKALLRKANGQDAEQTGSMKELIEGLDGLTEKMNKI
ncbi:uncharacterized protein ASPGLDRAFT_1489893 [Aspergillus glaucus CBS 516.65]|uniref:Nucleoside phosphorylase domain-containing protein n=1 Tax=Aspergillus glaucus CBS 516.65 TaxID=1160497 RepID=A0A1L9VZQ7_ASPGL|nr:hypothetical protein ASPGLDRAFT_1489893 [Aspergillus glaucus CBS 516.65]OJJ89327.1 hypothetical protein ASPGLDRAFT_1489893 [Aspergillus glaucus CBS 516.65]